MIVSEIMESEKISLIKNFVDIFQIGARNMQNFPLITNVAKTLKPILLKRHFGCSIRDLLGAAEYALIEKMKKLFYVKEVFQCLILIKVQVDFY